MKGVKIAQMLARVLVTTNVQIVVKAFVVVVVTKNALNIAAPIASLIVTTLAREYVKTPALRVV